MKIRKLIFACMIYFAMNSLVIAAGIGGPISPIGNLNIAVGVEDNIIFDKDIELSSALTSFEYDTVNQIYGKFSIRLTDYINLYTKLGASNSGKIKRKRTDGSTTDIETDYGFLWGVGGSGAYLITETLRIGIDIQYNSWEADAGDVTEGEVEVSDVSGAVDNREFQTALFIAKEFDLAALLTREMNITPYVGCIYNDFASKTDENIKYSVSSTSYELNWELDGADSWGLLVGADIISRDAFIINIEGRFIDENALTAGVSWKF